MTKRPSPPPQPEVFDPPKSILTRYASDTGLRFGLDDDLFKCWWNAIPEMDREGFKFHGGDVALARFVCAFDCLTRQQGTPSRTSAIIYAYAAAYGIDPTIHACRVRGAAAFEHEAVSYLLDQFEYRALRNTRERMVPMFSLLLQTTIQKATESDDWKERVAVLGSASRFMRDLALEDTAARNLRMKRSVQRAMERTFKESDAVDEAITDSDINRHVEELVRLRGKKSMLALVAGVQTELQEKHEAADVEVVDLAADGDDEPEAE